MTRTQKIAYGLLVHMIALLLAYLVVSLIGAVKFLGDDPLALTLPYHQVNGFANVLIRLAVLSGLLGAGVYAAASARAQNALNDERLLAVSYRLWSIVVLLGCAAGVLGMLEAQNGLELPRVLDAAAGFVILLLTGNVLISKPRVAIIPIWVVGMMLYVIGIIIGLIPSNDILQDRVLRGLAVGVQQYVAIPVSVVAIAFWLMHRFSNITPRWAQMGVQTVAGLVALAGAWLTLPQFYTLNGSEGIRTLGSLGVVIIPMVYLIFAAHTYRAFSDRNTNATLSAHWLALGVLLFIVNAALLGGLNALPGIHDYLAGTRLSDLQSALLWFAAAAVMLGVFNQMGAELRGQNQRITGLAPFWLVTFGTLGASLALAAAGVVQVYLERLLSIGYLETQTLIIPLYTLWFGGLVLLGLGIVTYAMGAWARRPSAQDAVKSGL